MGKKKKRARPLKPSKAMSGLARPDGKELKALESGRAVAAGSEYYADQHNIAGLRRLNSREGKKEREMGGKGRKRRERNYRAAHGGHARLPPPPNPSQVDALPRKLRKLISLTSNLHNDPAKNPESKEEKTKRRDGDAKKKRHREDGIAAEATTVRDEGDDGEEIVNSSGDEKRKKKKRKGNQVNDLRFGLALDKTRTVEKRRERKKK